MCVWGGGLGGASDMVWPWWMYCMFEGEGVQGGICVLSVHFTHNDVCLSECNAMHVLTVMAMQQNNNSVIHSNAHSV